MAEINLIKIDGKPLEKLIDVISKGVGTVYRPRAIKKEAEAKAYEIEIIERAKSKALAEGKEIDVESLERIQNRILYQELKRQKNIDFVSCIAANQLEQENDVSNEPVNEDWSTRFFEIVKDISNEEMQILWGRILAGEVKQPKSYSLRTLELLKNLSKDEAEIFTKFANLRVVSESKNFIYNDDNGKFLKQEFGIQFVDRLLLTELGLISSENNLRLSLIPNGDKQIPVFFIYGNKVISIQRMENTPEQSIQVLMFTKAGIELSKLINQEINIKYIEEICSRFKHPNVNIQFGDLVTLPDKSQIMDNPIDYK
jgi:uncharacterized repeat protein (TIGR03899 family)